MESPPSPRYRWVALVTVLFGLFTFGTITTVISASLDRVADDLDTTTNALAWAITGPFLALGVGNPIFGKLGDIYGRRRFFLLGLVVFTASSLATGFAPDAAWLIALRALAGLGASAATPNGAAIVLEAFTIDERPKALGWFNLIGVGAPAIGLALGGVMVEQLGWRAVFWIYGAISVVATATAVVVIRPTPAGERQTIDWAGAGALTVATVGVALGLTLAGTSSIGDPTVLAVLALCPIGVAAFVAVERRARHPLAPLEYFRVPNFAAPLAGYFFGHVTYMGAFVITPILLRDVFTYREELISLILLMRPGSFSLSSPFGGAAAGRFGIRRTARMGTIPLIVGTSLFAVGAATEMVVFVVLALMCAGIGMGTTTPSYMSALTSAVRESELGLASGLLQMAASLGTVVGIQLAVMLLGDASPHASGDFVLPYLVGVGTAVAMFGCSLVVRGGARPALVVRDPAAAPAAVLLDGADPVAR